MIEYDILMEGGLVKVKIDTVFIIWCLLFYFHEKLTFFFRDVA